MEDAFILKLYFGVYEYSVVEMFSLTSRNILVSQTRCMKYIIIIFGNYKIKGPLCFQWVCLAEDATNRRHNLPKSLET